MAQIVLEKLVKRYGDLQVVHGIDLEIKPKEFIVLVGPSGCGKSTTLRMVAGLEEITDGKISIGDKIVNDLNPKDRDIAMVFQNYALYPHMNIYDNMSFSLKIKKVDKAEIDKRVREAATILGIENLLERRPGELSGGQRQRVAMGRAIVRNPSVFLFDEPLSNLDAKLRTQMRAEIKKLHMRMGTTVVYVTHDQVEAMTLADRIVILKDGHIEQVGTPLEIYTNPANTFVAGFIGSPPMNVVDPNLYPNLSLPEEFKDKLLGARPEHMQIAFKKDESHWGFSGKIEVVEPLGGETLVHVSLNLEETDLKHLFVAKLPGSNSYQVGDVIELEVSKENMRLFDRESKLAVNK